MAMAHNYKTSADAIETDSRLPLVTIIAQAPTGPVAIMVPRSDTSSVRRGAHGRSRVDRHSSDCFARMAETCCRGHTRQGL
jgi:hypothetical protein